MTRGRNEIQTYPEHRSNLFKRLTVAALASILSSYIGSQALYWDIARLDYGLLDYLHFS